MSMKKTIRNVLSEAIETLLEHNVQDAKIDATLLLEHVLQVERVHILIHSDDVIDDKTYKTYTDMIRLREEGNPLQYIIGHTEFMGLVFKVNEHVLIPRQDTEILVEEAIRCIKDNHITHILEIGTGSGCIPISICAQCRDIKVTTVDISQDAITVAKENARVNHVEERIEFIHSDVLENIDKSKRYDMIISNPPYIKARDIEDLMREVRDHEPLGALDGGVDGLDFYRGISRDAIEVASDISYIFYEVGYNQSAEVRRILEDLGYSEVCIIKDLTGINRVVTGMRLKK